MTRVREFGRSLAWTEARSAHGKNDQIRLPLRVAVGGLAYHVPSMLEIRRFVRTDLTKLDQGKVERLKCRCWGKR